MDFLTAVEWVRSNEAVIKGNIVKYRNFSPYEECDYMQEAFEAAMVATLRVKEKEISFEAAFWKIFRRQVSLFTPNPDDKSNGSNSVPSHLCSVDIDSITIRQRAKRGRKKPNIEAIFYAVSPEGNSKSSTCLWGFRMKAGFPITRLPIVSDVQPQTSVTSSAGQINGSMVWS